MTIQERLKELKKHEKRWLKSNKKTHYKDVFGINQLNYTRARIDELEMAIKGINKEILNWWNDENTCSGKPHCCVQECDLCVNCFDDLVKRFGVKK